jgi:hypothetical protein
VAQAGSKPGQVTLIARMPETLNLSINGNRPAYLASAISATDNPEVATAITTAWSLMPGRTNVVTWATTKHVTATVMTADASAPGLGPSPDGRSTPAHGSAVRPDISNTKMTGTGLTDANRKGASTALLPLPDSTDPSQIQPSPANTSPGILRIQIQPVL